MNEFLITINDIYKNNSYSKNIDIPKHTRRAFIRIIKFQASITRYQGIPNNIVLSIDDAINTYSNNASDNLVIRSPIVDIFHSLTFIENESLAYYNYENQNQKWIELNVSSLYNIKFNFKTYTTLNNAIDYIELRDFNNNNLKFPFILQFALKFE